MKQISPERLRNVVLLSHSGAGKTTLSEAMLFASGAVNRLGKIETGTTTSDYDPDEIKHHISIKPFAAAVRMAGTQDKPPRHPPDTWTSWERSKPL